MIFVEGEPERLDAATFRRDYGVYFPSLLPHEDEESEVVAEKDRIVNSSIDSVYTMFAGVNTLWKHLKPEVWYAKSRLCYALLTAWYITDLYPDKAVGVVSTGGLPIKSKKIGGVEIVYDIEAMKRGNWSSLQSNVFGNKALQMMKTSGSLLRIFGRQ